MQKYTAQEKIDFFDANWGYIERIINVLQNQTKKHLKAGENVLEFLADWLERNF